MKILSTTPQNTPAPEQPERPKVNSTAIQEHIVKNDTPASYAADYFNLKDIPSLILEPKLDVNQIVEKITFLEDYLSEQLRKNQMNVDGESFRSILSDIERTLGVDSKYELSHRISRVYGFLNIVKKTKDSSEKRKMLLNKYFKK